jgi:hypothetical protein
MNELGSQCEIKRCALAFRGIRLNASAVLMNDPLNNSENYARPFVLVGAMQTLKNAEDLVSITHIEPGPVIPYEIDVFLIV